VRKALELGEGHDEQPRIKCGELVQNVGLVQLHQMLRSVESSQMAQEDQSDRLGIGGEVDGRAVGGGQREVRGRLARVRQSQY
jgi:hypothetical protein